MNTQFKTPYNWFKGNENDGEMLHGGNNDRLWLKGDPQVAAN